MAEAPDIAHVARIARLALTPEELARLAGEVRGILGHFEAVLAAAGAAPAGEPQGLEPRPDEPEGPDPAEVAAIVAQFPRKEGPFAKTPGGP